MKYLLSSILVVSFFLFSSLCISGCAVREKLNPEQSAKPATPLLTSYRVKKAAYHPKLTAKMPKAAKAILAQNLIISQHANKTASATESKPLLVPAGAEPLVQPENMAVEEHESMQLAPYWENLSPPVFDNKQTGVTAKKKFYGKGTAAPDDRAMLGSPGAVAKTAFDTRKAKMSSNSSFLIGVIFISLAICVGLLIIFLLLMRRDYASQKP